jgi:fructuronate reductase
MSRLSARSKLLPGALRPAYEPLNHGFGIVHLGLGAFHKAHQAVYTDTALARSGGDWRIQGVSLRSEDVADALNPQDGLFTLLERGRESVTARVIGSIGRAIAARREPGAVMAALCDPATRIVSLTVTEKAYGIIRATGSVDESHAAVAHDLSQPTSPEGVLGYLVQALARRRASGTVPFTVLCCDNLPENGKLLRAGVLDFAGRTDPALKDWIAENVPFPSTMVDRITPASTAKTFADAARFTGFEDLAAVETEPFLQWVIEDDFVSGRPDWEAGGAIFTTNVAPYENMKLRMLNGSHSMLAYAGYMSGRTYVRDVMASGHLSILVQRHLHAAAATLEPLEGIDFAEYADALLERFANPEIAHETYQIAMDGSQKMPQRVFMPALKAIDLAADLKPFAFATAAWMRYTLGRKDDGTRYELRDPAADKLAKAVEGQSSAHDIYQAIAHISDIMPTKLADNQAFQSEVIDVLGVMLEQGMQAAIDRQATR